NKIYAQTCELNTRSRNLLEKCGFCVDARLRQHHEYNSFFYDDYIYSILRDDYMLHGGLDEDV
ncbi:MAG: GNAT family N-acetyltransferase, partial [Acetivibrio ethanolgignens]